MSIDIRTAVTELFMIQQIKTGNLWADAIIFGFFIFTLYQSAILTNVKSVYKKLEVVKNQPMKKNWAYLINKFKKKSIVYTGYMYSSGYRTVSTYVDYPPPMIHVLDYMQNNVYKVENTYNIKYCEVIDVETNTVVKTFIPADELVSFELYPDIYIELSSDKHVPNKDKKTDFLDFLNITFYIKTYEHDISYIHSFIKMCGEKFEDSINEQLSKQKYIFKYNGKKSVGGDQERRYDDNGECITSRHGGIKCDEYPLITSKHLIRNCFFTQRDALIERINFFIHNEQWYNDRGIPYQLTLVFEGPAGCGKTSTVKGIATYTNRHIVDVDLNGIKDVCELENIFNGTHINGKYIPSNKRIFMIDEIDKFFELLDDREQKEKMRLAATTKEPTNSSIVIVKEGSGGGAGGGNGLATTDSNGRFGLNSISGCANRTATNDLTKGQILSIMDGIIESKGRFIICTANDTSKIDPTFKRPGRMDEFIHFTKCDALMIHQLMDLFYDGTVDEQRVRSKEELERFKTAELKLSPTELNKICFNHVSSRDEAEKHIVRALGEIVE
jgi:hypothetical protein